MSTIFIAVQCCQCSTMQVKQRKQSSNNKWTCVVCNQKQSVLKVFAQGPMAKDLRLFVQSFNMSRHFTHQTPNPPPSQQHQHSLVSDNPHETRNKRRTDWTQFLDPEDDQRTKIEPEVDEGPEIVTELPPELFKKPKLNKESSGSDTRKCVVDELNNHKPVLSKRNFKKHVVSPKDEEQRKCEFRITQDTSKWSHFMMQDEQEPRTCQATKATPTGASKWNDYVTKDYDDVDDSRLVSRRKHADSVGEWSNEIYKTIANYETVTNDERVEDDIHPDFLQGSLVSDLGTTS